MDPYDQIIWSADVPSEETLMACLDTMPELKIIKIDRLFVTDNGLSIVDRLGERGIKVFDDAKIAEIPSKAEAIAKRHLLHQPFMLNCMADIQSSGILTSQDPDQLDGLKRFAEACHEVGTKPCGVTILSSKTPALSKQEFNGRSTTEQVLYYVEALSKAGFTDIVCSPHEVKAIRAESRFNQLDLNTPGIRPVDSGKGDQTRVDTPAAVIAAGANRLIIGRPITEGNPVENLKKIAISIS